MLKDKILYLDTVYIKQAESDNTLTIEGYASTNDPDRQGDVVNVSAWEKGLDNYLKNPILLAYHDHQRPVGKVVEHKIDSKGLWIKAKISKAAQDIYELVKDGIITAFSIGFRVKDAEYNTLAELFVIKELELHEISVVSVPANQNTLFNLAKSFENLEEFTLFKQQFALASESAKRLENGDTAKSTTIEEFNMDAEQVKQMLADAAKQAAEETAKQLVAEQAKQAAKQAADEKAEQELQLKIKQAVASIQTTETGTEKLLAEIEKRFETERESHKQALEGLESVVKEKAQELEALQKSKMQFNDKNTDLDYKAKENAVLLARMSGKSIEQTRYGKQLIEKAGAHVASATWELEVSLNMEAEVRRRLVVAPTLRSIPMQTNVMTIPVNPEAGVATWVTNVQFGTSNSAGGNTTHQLKEITLNAYKVATNEYVAFEEEEDALMALMPIIRDAMVRRVARAVDRAMLRGAGAGSDPVKGLATYDATADVSLDISDNNIATVANLRTLRKGLGAWGLDPSEIIYIVSQDVYYDLLDDSTFQTMDKVGAQATLLTGQIGVIGNTPVLVSAEFAAKAAGAVAAIAYAPANFLVGNQRGLRIDTDDLVETQRRVLVASLRTGLTQISTNQGEGVTKMAWIA